MTEGSWFEPVVRYFDQIRDKVAELLPNLLGALVLVVVGWVLAWLLRAVIVRLIPRLYRLIPSRAVQRGLKTSGVERLAAEIIAGILYWLVFIIFLAAATEALGLPVVPTLVSALARYLPSVLAAVVVIVVGTVLANICRTAIVAAAASAGVAYGELLGRTAYVTLLLVASVVAIDQLGIDSTFLTVTLAIVLLATTGGLALGFGLGARATVSNLLAAHYLAQSYRVGQQVRLGETEGRIVEITSTAVILETPAGRAVVPAQRFTDSTSILLGETH